MIHPRNVLLVLVLAVLVALNLRLLRPAPTAGPVESIFPDLDVAAVHRIEITEPTDAGPRTLEFARGADGWTLPGHHRFPALPAAVEGLLGRIAHLATVDRVGTSPASHADFGVTEETARRLRLEGADGTVLVDLLQGLGPAGTPGSYVRPLPRSAVYRTADLAPLSTRAGRWIDTRLLSVDPAAVQGLSARLVPDDGGPELSIDLLRLDDGRWRVLNAAPDARPAYLAPAAVAPLFPALQSLFFRAVVDAGPGEAMAGFGPPHLTVELDVGEEELTALWIGPPHGADERLATVPRWEGRWVVSVPAASAARLAALVERIARLR